MIAGINDPVRTGRWRVVGRSEVRGFVYPGFLNGIEDAHGVIHDWWLWDGKAERRLGKKLPEAYRGYEMMDAWPAGLLEDRIQAALDEQGSDVERR